MTHTSVRDINTSWNTKNRVNGTKNEKLPEFGRQPGIMLPIGYEVTVTVKPMVKGVTMAAKRLVSMTTSIILFLFQSAYVRRTKKHSEQVNEIRPKDLIIFINIWHSLIFSFGATARCRFMMVIKKGTYRAVI
jgi:hypothetical protein